MSEALFRMLPHPKATCKMPHASHIAGTEFRRSILLQTRIAFICAAAVASNQLQHNATMQLRCRSARNQIMPAIAALIATSQSCPFHS